MYMNSNRNCITAYHHIHHKGCWARQDNQWTQPRPGRTDINRTKDSKRKKKNTRHVLVTIYDRNYDISSSPPTTHHPSLVTQSSTKQPKYTNIKLA